MTEDLELARSFLVPLGDSFREVAAFVVPGEPPSKARPRVTRGRGGKVRVYSSTKQRNHERRLGWRFLEVVPEPMTESVAISMAFVRGTRQRVDIDNMVKHVFDSANGICWVDDVQVTFCASHLSLDRQRPRTAIVVGRHIGGHRDNLHRSTVCEGCGSQFNWKVTQTAKPRRFCSRKCSAFLKDPVPCRQCGQPFVRRHSSVTLCSEVCRIALLQQSNRSRRKHNGACQDCGKQVFNKAVRCRDCWRISVAASAASKG